MSHDEMAPEKQLQKSWKGWMDHYENGQQEIEKQPQEFEM